jgi:hypothetical protein
MGSYRLIILPAVAPLRSQLAKRAASYQLAEEIGRLPLPVTRAGKTPAAPSLRNSSNVQIRRQAESPQDRAFSGSPWVLASNHDYLPSICLEEEFGRLDPREILTSTR